MVPTQKFFRKNLQTFCKIYEHASVTGHSHMPCDFYILIHHQIQYYKINGQLVLCDLTYHIQPRIPIKNIIK
jgi:hypothetical protein